MSNLEDQIKEKEAELSALSSSMINYSEQVENLKESVKEKEEIYEKAETKFNDLLIEVAKSEDSLKQLNDSISEKHDKFLGQDQERETASGEYLKTLEGHK